jgi:hypothetical protein
MSAAATAAGTREELIAACKQAGIRGYSGKRKEEIVELLSGGGGQDTGKFRSNLADQFYTKPAVARKCVDRIREVIAGVDGWTWIEPSAGKGAFLRAAPAGVALRGFDIDPKEEGVQRGDFLQWKPGGREGTGRDGGLLLFGNPPFGRQGSLAKAFVQHGAMFADAIAFILPRSFVKPSMNRAFPLCFHCVWSEDVEKDAFEVNGAEYDVPCVFQIWLKREVNREVEDVEEPVGFHYVKAGEAFDIAFRRVGVYAGRCFAQEEGREYSPQSHYFLKLEEVTKRGAVIAAVNAVEFPSNTVGPRSVSKGEANAVLNRIIGNYT